MASVTVVDVILTLILVSMSALFSGLTLGYLGLDVTGLEIIMASDSAEAEYARKVIPLRRRGNLLLCTLLLGNVAVNAALSIVLSELTSGVVGFLASTILIVIFGEIIPQALCSRHGLYIGSKVLPVVYTIILILFLFAWPISKILDYALGDELGTIYNRKGLRKLVEIHQKHQMAELRKEEADIMSGALDFAEKTVRDVFTPMGNCFVLDVSQKLDFELLSEIFKSGFSRIPCFDSSHLPVRKCVGILLVKDLILLDPEDSIPVGTILNIYGREIPLQVFPDVPLGEMLRSFKSQRVHLAIVQDVETVEDGDPFYVNVGIITLEDIIEVILKDNIVDETDVYVNVNVADPIKVPRGVFDISRLNVFNDLILAKSDESILSKEEILAVFYHLKGCLEDFACLSADLHRDLLLKSQVILVTHIGTKRRNHYGLSTPHPEEQKRVVTDIAKGGTLLYQRNKRTEYVTLILSGRVAVRSGRNEFESTVGRWCVLGSDILHEVRQNIEQSSQVELDYVSDFSAVAISDARVLRIRISDYADALRQSQDDRARANEAQTFFAFEDMTGSTEFESIELQNLDESKE